MDEKSVVIEINNEHKLANNCYQNKNLKEYLNILTDELEYKQLNGKVVSKKQISEDTKKYFNRIVKIENRYDRLSFDLKNTIFTERLIQNSKFEISVFLFFTKRWSLKREVIYKWRKINDRWKIINVEILSERVK